MKSKKSWSSSAARFNFAAAKYKPADAKFNSAVAVLNLLWKYRNKKTNAHSMTSAKCGQIISSLNQIIRQTSIQPSEIPHQRIVIQLIP